MKHNSSRKETTETYDPFFFLNLCIAFDLKRAINILPFIGVTPTEGTKNSILVITEQHDGKFCGHGGEYENVFLTEKVISLFEVGQLKLRFPSGGQLLCTKRRTGRVWNIQGRRVLREYKERRKEENEKRTPESTGVKEGQSHMAYPALLSLKDTLTFLKPLEF